ncbi:MAG: hypothetical protein JXQ87_16915 [Bacteroidia bacterium]
MKKNFLIILAILPLALFGQEYEKPEWTLGVTAWNESIKYTSTSNYTNSSGNTFTQYSSTNYKEFSKPFPTVSFSKNRLHTWEFGIIDFSVRKHESIDKIDSATISVYKDNSGTINTLDLNYFVVRKFGFEEKFLPDVFIQFNLQKTYRKNKPLVSNEFNSRSFFFQINMILGAEYSFDLTEHIVGKAGLQIAPYRLVYNNRYTNNPSLSRYQRNTSYFYLTQVPFKAPQLRLGLSYKL